VRGAELRLGEGIEEIGASSLLLKSGETLHADVVYKCVGVMPNTAMLKASPTFSASFGFRDSIEVNDHLQVAGNPKIYCVGDMCARRERTTVAAAACGSRDAHTPCARCASGCLTRAASSSLGTRLR
jgi:NADH dehydrogenase FAD-containing subunit